MWYELLHYSIYIYYRQARERAMAQTRHNMFKMSHSAVMCARNACCRAVWWKAYTAVGVLMVLRSCCTIDIPDCMVLSFFLLLLLPFGIRFRMMLCRYHTHDTPVYRRRLSTLYYYGERNKSKKRKKEKNTTEKRSHSNNANWGAFSTWCEWTKQEKETGSWIYINVFTRDSRV